MGVMASVDVVIIHLSFVFKVLYKRNTVYIKREMAVSLPVDEITASIFSFLYCTLKTVQGFHPEFCNTNY